MTKKINFGEIARRKAIKKYSDEIRKYFDGFITDEMLINCIRKEAHSGLNLKEVLETLEKLGFEEYRENRSRSGRSPDGIWTEKRIYKVYARTVYGRYSNKKRDETISSDFSRYFEESEKAFGMNAEDFIEKWGEELGLNSPIISEYEEDGTLQGSIADGKVSKLI